MLFLVLYYLILTIILFFGTICLLYYFYQKYSRFYTMIVKLPATSALPVFGHSLQWNRPEDETWTYMREQINSLNPFLTVYTFHFGLIMTTQLDDIEKLLSSPKHIKKGVFYKMFEPWLNTGLLTSTGDKWIHRRKMLTPAFHFAILQKFLTTFNEETQKLVQTLQGYLKPSNVDVMPIITQFTLSTIAETAMGTKLDEGERYEQYRKGIYEIAHTYAYRSVRPWLYINFLNDLTIGGLKSRKCIKQLHEFTENVIRNRERMLNQESDGKPTKKMAMLDLLLSAKKQGESISYEGIREEVDTFMFEGHDTTTAAITFLLLMLANHPDIQEKCYEEIVSIVINDNENPTYGDLQNMPYIERCIKETLRLYPSVPHISRTLDEDFITASGHVLPKGSDVLVSIFDLHRRPDLYPDPEKFDPDRFLLENCKNRHPYAYIPFSAGPRNCIGQKFAMLEIKSMLCGILRKFRLEAVTVPEEVTFRLDLVLRPITPIKVKFVLRNN